MPDRRFRSPLIATLTVAGLLTQSLPVRAGQRSDAQALEQATGAKPAAVVVTQDARETRQQFEEILKRLPPAVGRVLRLDPSLMRNQSYLAPYPALASFLQSHPEVVNNPAYYLENVNLQLWNPPSPPDARADAIRLWNSVLEGLAIFAVVGTIVFVVTWILRSLIEYRRWYRVSKVQAEVHNKLLDRFTSNEELLAYVQTPAGRRFLESMPLPVDSPARPVHAPFGRILWSVQAGVVLAIASLGLMFISTRAIDEVAQVLFAIGVLALALGVGFIVSALASFLLSRRLGLLEPAGTREHSEPSGA